MKKILSILAIAGVIMSCSQKDLDDAIPCTEQFVAEAQQFPQAWRLVKMTGSMINSETTGESMSYQELIELNADNSFAKTRQQNNQTKNASGSYFFSQDPVDDAVMLTLTYSSGNDLIGSCTGQADTETYYFRSTCTMVGTWLMCDGPGLEYERHLSTPSGEEVH